MTDQNGTVRAYSYDLLGRMTDDAVTTLGTGVDGAVRRIGRAYEVRGLPYQVTSYSDTGGTSVANQVQYAYNSFQQLVTEYQAHGGVVNTSSTPSVDYTYLDGSTNTVRPTSINYPTGYPTGRAVKNSGKLRHPEFSRGKLRHPEFSGRQQAFRPRFGWGVSIGAGVGATTVGTFGTGVGALTPILAY